MKFTKENAVEKLNQILTNGGKKTLRMSTRTLDAQTESLMSLIADDEMELDAFVEKVKVILESTNSNIEHDNSDFIRTYQEQHPAPNPPTPPTPPAPDDPQAKLLERIAELEKKEQERADAAVLVTKKAGIKKYLSDNNVKDDSWIEMAMGLSGIKADDDVEAKGKSLLEFYNKSKASGAPVPPGKPNPGDGNGVQFDDVKALMKQRVDI